MPYPNEHSCRVSEPLSQETGVFARKQIAPGISVIIQRSKSGGSMKAQAYRFGKNQYTPEEAKAWLKKHDISCRFEPASSGNEETRKEIIERITKELSGAIIA